MHTRHRVRDILTGAVLTAMVMGLATPAMAALNSKLIEVYTGASIYIDGVELNPTDANGNPVETFVYNGTTYVPLRAVSQSLGKEVNWDGNTQSVYIGTMPGTEPSLWDVCPPYQKEHMVGPTTVKMAGQQYENAMTGANYGFYTPSFAWFNLNGQYTNLEFDVGHIDGQEMYGTTLNVYLDGELAIAIDLNAEMLPKHYNIPLKNALQMKIEIPAVGFAYGLANLKIS